MSDAPHIDAIVEAFTSSSEPVVDLVTYLLGPDELQQMIACVVEAQIETGWRLLPPCSGALTIADLTTKEIM